MPLIYVLLLAFLNLESVGSNGKEILFQSGPNHGWLIDVSSIPVIQNHSLASTSQLIIVH